jgi:hypothetical protein
MWKEVGLDVRSLYFTSKHKMETRRPLVSFWADPRADVRGDEQIIILPAWTQIRLAIHIDKSALSADRNKYSSSVI